MTSDSSPTRNEGALKPLIEIELTAPEELSLTLPFSINVKLRRAVDTTLKPCIFRWELSNALAQGDLLLFHETANGSQLIPIDHPMWNQKDALTLGRYEVNFIQLSPGSEIKFLDPLPLRYREKLQAGETYRLQWPGSEVSMWEWGTLEEHLGCEITSRRVRDPPEPSLIVGSKTDALFKAIEEAEPWPDRPVTTDEIQFLQANRDEERWRVNRDRVSPPPLGPHDRSDGAPLFSMTLQCPSEWKGVDTQNVILTVTHEPSPHEDTKPVTFRTATFWSGWLGGGGPCLYRRKGDSWERWVDDDDSTGGFLIADDPPIPIHVGDESKYGAQFVTLYPGESWTYTFTRQGKNSSYLPEDSQPGDQFKYIMRGSHVDWWDWGTKEDHRETRVVLHCITAAELVEPRDNGGRPQLIVPASNTVYFTYLG